MAPETESESDAISVLDVVITDNATTMPLCATRRRERLASEEKQWELLNMGCKMLFCNF